MKFLLFCIILVLVGCSRPPKLHKTFEDPKGEYVIEVYADNVSSGSPGDSSSASGVVYLKRLKTGQIIYEKKTDMISLIETVRWSKNSVYVKLFVEWQLDYKETKLPEFE